MNVGKCTEIPDALGDCSNDGACSIGDFGPGWACLNGRCTNVCGPGSAGGTDKGKCLCDPSGERPALAPDAGYQCVATLGTSVDLVDGDKIRAIYGDDVALGRQIVPKTTQEITGRLITSRDSGLHVVANGVKFTVDPSRIPADFSHHIASADSPGELRTWSAFTSRGLPDTTARATTVSWPEAVRRLDEDVPYPDGDAIDPDTGYPPNEGTPWPVDRVFPDFYELIAGAGGSGLNAALFAPYLKRTDAELTAEIAALTSHGPWRSRMDLISTDPGKDGAMNQGIWQTLFKRADQGASTACPNGQVVVGVDLTNTASGVPALAVRCSPPGPSAPQLPADSTLRGMSNRMICWGDGADDPAPRGTVRCAAQGLPNSHPPVPAHPRFQALALASANWRARDSRGAPIHDLSSLYPTGLAYNKSWWGTDGVQASTLWDDPDAPRTVLEADLAPDGSLAAPATLVCPKGWAVRDFAVDTAGRKLRLECSDLQRGPGE